jgi:hypothetical protein
LAVSFVAAAAAAAMVSVAAIGISPAKGALPNIPYPVQGIAAGGPRDQYTYVWAPGVLEAVRMYLPSEAPVLTVRRETPTKRAVCELAIRLGVRVLPEEYATMPETQELSGFGTRLYGRSFESTNVEDQRRFWCKDVELWDSRCFAYWHRGETPTPGSPAWDREALPAQRTEEIAEQFLAESGLLPEGCEFETVRPAIAQNAEGVETYHSDGARPRVLSRQVEYARRIEGIELGRFTVSINGNGVVYRVHRQVPNVARLGRYPILSPEEARRLLPRGLLPSHIWGPATAEIESVSLYFSQDWDSSDVIQPIYSFKGTARGEQGATEPFAVSWPAVRPECFLTEGDIR